MAFSITIPADQIEFLQKTIGQQSTRQASYQAVKRTTSAARGVMRDTIGENVDVDLKYVDRAVSSKLITTDASLTEGVITVSAKSIPLIGFHPTAGPGGVTVVLTRSLGPVVLRHAFSATVSANGGNHRGIMTRKAATEAAAGRGRTVTKRGFFGRLPIKELKGPDIVSLIGEQNLTVTGEQVIRGLQGVFLKNLQSQMDRFLNQKKGTGIQLAGI